MNNKNICIITDHYPIPGYPMYTFLEQLVNNFSAQNVNCHVICPSSISKFLIRKFPLKPKFESREYKGNFIKIYSPRYFSFSNRNKLGTAAPKAALFSFNRAVQNQFRKIIKTTKIDVVYAHFIFPSGIVASRIAKKYSITSAVAYGENTLYTINMLGLERTKKELKYIDKVIAVSTKNERVLIDNGIFDANKVRVFLNGTDLNKFKKYNKTSAREKLGLPNDKFIVCFVGGFIEVKGVLKLVDALNNIESKNIGSIFIGKGPLNPLHHNVLFKGVVDNDKIPLYLSASDVFVLPSTAEGLSNAIVEALACGLPIIASDLSFNYDILNNKNSILVDPLSVEEIKRAILTIYNDKNLALNMAEEAFISGQKLNIDTRAKNILSFLFEKESQ